MLPNFFWQTSILLQIYRQNTNINVQDCTFRELKGDLTRQLDAACLDPKQLFFQNGG
jgi:hypothetical protein